MHSAIQTKDRKPVHKTRVRRAQLKLWKFMKMNYPLGMEFCHQYLLGPYVLQFYSPEERFCIEVTGELDPHQSLIMKDILKSRFLHKSGIRILQFTASDVIERTDWVLAMIKHRLDKKDAPHFPEPKLLVQDFASI